MKNNFFHLAQLPHPHAVPNANYTTRRHRIEKSLAKQRNEKKTFYVAWTHTRSHAQMTRVFPFTPSTSPSFEKKRQQKNSKNNKMKNKRFFILDEYLTITFYNHKLYDFFLMAPAATPSFENTTANSTN